MIEPIFMDISFIIWSHQLDLKMEALHHIKDNSKFINFNSCYFLFAVGELSSQVVMKNSTKLCSSKPIVTVNGKFPGPTLYAREHDTVLVKVVNHVKYNVTIHW